jgi:hypothetical protein
VIEFGILRENRSRSSSANRGDATIMSAARLFEIDSAIRASPA